MSTHQQAIDNLTAAIENEKAAYVSSALRNGWTEGKILKGFKVRFMLADDPEIHNLIEQARTALPELIAPVETETPQPTAEEEPKYGDFDGPLRNIWTDKGPACVDHEGVDVDTGVRYKLTPKQFQEMAILKSDQKKNKLNRVVQQAEYDAAKPISARRYDYDGLVVSGTFCLWLGARKAEKSLFALRKAMHDACGKSWFNYQNLVGPVKVLYFDSENDSGDVDERYREIIQEFTTEEQQLIKANLKIALGVELKKEGSNIEYQNTELWEVLKKRYDDARVVYLDCWYQFQNIKASDNGMQKEALEAFRKYFPNATLFLLHHTGRESQESLLRKNPTWLRYIGAERWSNKASGGNIITKIAELIFCQEKYVERDEEGVEGTQIIDFQGYSRSSLGTILLSFEPVFTEETNGVINEYKFRRRLIIRLSTLAATAIKKLQGRGVWDSKHQMAKDIGMVGGKQYRAIDELIVKGFITREGTMYWLNESEEAIEMAAENIVAVKSAGKLLDELLLRPDGTPNEGMKFEDLQKLADAQGVSMTSLRKARSRREVKTIDRNGTPFWVASEKRRKK